MADNEVKTFDLNELISKTVAETMKAVAPYMNLGMPAAAPSGPGNPEVSTNPIAEARQRAIQSINQEYENTLRANREAVRRIAETPESEYVTVMIPAIYQKYFGPSLPVGHNMSIITVPIDGKRHRIPRVFESAINQALAYEDEKVAFSTRTAGNDTAQVINTGAIIGK